MTQHFLSPVKIIFLLLNFSVKKMSTIFNNDYNRTLITIITTLIHDLFPFYLPLKKLRVT